LRISWTRHSLINRSRARIAAASSYAMRWAGGYDPVVVFGNGETLHRVLLADTTPSSGQDEGVPGARGLRSRRRNSDGRTAVACAPRSSPVAVPARHAVLNGIDAARGSRGGNTATVILLAMSRVVRHRGHPRGHRGCVLKSSGGSNLVDAIAAKGDSYLSPGVSRSHAGIFRTPRRRRSPRRSRTGSLQLIAEGQTMKSIGACSSPRRDPSHGSCRLDIRCRGWFGARSTTG
jgi:hypothetical protein